MPDYFVGGSDQSSAPTSLDVFTTVGALKQLQQSIKEAAPQQ